MRILRTCYFLLNVVAYTPTKVLATSSEPTCYFLLNVVEAHSTRHNSASLPTPCYFLLNVVRPEGSRPMGEAQTQAQTHLLFSFECCSGVGRSARNPWQATRLSCYFLLNVVTRHVRRGGRGTGAGRGDLLFSFECCPDDLVLADTPSTQDYNLLFSFECCATYSTTYDTISPRFGLAIFF